ncbi:MAG: hypothetical protein KAH32_05810 [Chlamydiia bacterium]|nr:hypothetical protein [Chlamydiia bacterium]
MDITPEVIFERFMKAIKGEESFRFFIQSFTGNKFKDLGARFNVKSALISRDGKLVYLLFKRPPIKPELEGYLYDVEIRDLTYKVFRTKKEFHKDILIFFSGRYTEMSRETKKFICSYSGMQYNIKNVATTIYGTDPRLHALYPKSHLHKIISIVMDVPLKDMATELLPTIKADSLLYVENFINK